jgi:hypothetical protein
MGRDAFGPRYGCKRCPCVDFCSELGHTSGFRIHTYRPASARVAHHGSAALWLTQLTIPLAIDSLQGEEREELLTRGYITCQRKSELVLVCRCSHKSWDHFSAPGVEVPADPGALPVTPDGVCTELYSILSAENLLHLNHVLQTTTFGECCARLSDRPAFLQWLKCVGVSSLKDRQALANSVGKARRRKDSNSTGQGTASGPSTLHAGTEPLHGMLWEGLPSCFETQHTTTRQRTGANPIAWLRAE